MCTRCDLLRQQLDDTVAWIEERAFVADQIARAKPQDCEAMAKLESVRLRGRAKLIRLTLERP